MWSTSSTKMSCSSAIKAMRSSSNSGRVIMAGANEMCPSSFSSARVSSIFLVSCSSFFSRRASLASETALLVLAAASLLASATLPIASFVACAACLERAAIRLPVEPNRSAMVCGGSRGESGSSAMFPPRWCFMSNLR